MRSSRILLFISVFASVYACSEKDIDERTLENRNNLTVLRFEILEQDNPLYISKDLRGKIVGDTIIDIWAPNILDNKLLKPDIEFHGRKITLNGVEFNKGDYCDFKKPVELRLFGESAEKKYTVCLHSYTGLPIIWINTKNDKDIISKEEYLEASFRLQEDVTTRAPGDM